MPKVQLQRYKDTSKIIAPSFCPYRHCEERSDNLPIFDYTVYPSLCVLCKICTFVPESTITGEVLTADNRARIFEYLTSGNAKVAGSISGQIAYLRKEERIPISILISPVLFDHMVLTLFPDISIQNTVKNYYFSVDEAICYVHGCPVYLSRKLTKSLVQVVGEVEWT